MNGILLRIRKAEADRSYIDKTNNKDMCLQNDPRCFSPNDVVR